MEQQNEPVYSEAEKRTAFAMVLEMARKGRVPEDGVELTSLVEFVAKEVKKLRSVAPAHPTYVGEIYLQQASWLEALAGRLEREGAPLDWGFFDV